MNDYSYRATLVRILDGDSIVCDIDLGFYMTARMPVRLAHINAKERNEIGGKEATEHLKVLLGDGALLLRTYKPKDKFGRYLAEVFVKCNQIDRLDMNINQQMIEDGFAIAYEGGKR